MDGAPSPKRRVHRLAIRRQVATPPGLWWNIDVLDRADREARSFLNEAGFEHMRRQLVVLAGQLDPTHCDLLDVVDLGEFLELKDKGGVLGKINVRVFFFVHKPSRTIVVLGAMKKEVEGALPASVRLLMIRRKRAYLEVIQSTKRR